MILGPDPCLVLSSLRQMKPPHSFMLLYDLRAIIGEHRFLLLLEYTCTCVSRSVYSRDEYVQLLVNGKLLSITG